MTRTGRARGTLERILGVPIDPALGVRVHSPSSSDDADYEVIYAVVDATEDEARDLQSAAGLLAPESDVLARVLLATGWSVDPGAPPEWWPIEPASLGEQAARGLEPNGWVVSGYRDGGLFVLATRTPLPEPSSAPPDDDAQETTVT